MRKQHLIFIVIYNVNGNIIYEQVYDIYMSVNFNTIAKEIFDILIQLGLKVHEIMPRRLDDMLPVTMLGESESKIILMNKE